MFVGIRQIPIVTTPPDIALFERLLGDGSDLGSAIRYVAEPVAPFVGDGKALTFIDYSVKQVQRWPIVM